MATVTRTERTRSTIVATNAIPRLESGDRLTAEEYLHRYEAMPGVRAERIEGVVYVSSPVSLPHGVNHVDMSVWAGTYRIFTPGVGAAADSTIHLDRDNTPQPDIHLRILPSHGGRTTLTDDGKYVIGAPEMTIEIAASSVSYDLHDKRESYRRNGTLVYIVWRIEDERIDWFALTRNGRYQRQKSRADGLFKSMVFPGLWLDAEAALRGDMARVLEVLQVGLASPEHSAFVDRLKAEAARIAAQAAPQPEGLRP